MKKLLIAITAIGIGMGSISAQASEYCFDKYETRIAAANSELATLLSRLSEIDTRIAAIFVEKDRITDRIAAISDGGLTEAEQRELQKLSNELGTLKREQTALEEEGFAKSDRAKSLRTAVPANLQGELEGCVKAVQPVNTGVNLTIQVLAALGTGGASLFLPPKTLYVDMGEVLHGKPLGSEHAFVPKLRNDVAKVFGVDLENDNGVIGNAIKNPLQPWKW
jgi:hypothetical protein